MGFLKAPKAPEPTAQELAGVARQSRMIDEETEEMEKRLKAAARGKSGSSSLLAKAGKASGKSGSMSRRSMIGVNAGSVRRGASKNSGGGTYGSPSSGSNVQQA